MPDPEADYTIDIDWSEADALDDRPAPRPVTAWEGDEDDAIGQRSPGDDDPRIPAKVDRDLAIVQARAVRAQSAADDPEGQVKSGTITEATDRITFMDREFRIAERVGLMPLLKFSSASDVDTSDPRALSAMYALLRDCIYAGAPACGECADCDAGNDTSCKSYDRGDWGAFEEHAMLTKAGAEDLLDVVSEVLEIVSGRPTPPRPGSSAGQRQTQRASTARSSRGARGRGSRR